MDDKQRDEMLREMARHRGFRLVKSRRRKPGGDFGRYGLTDANTGQDCFGIGKSGLTASAEDIQDYLRKGEVSTWKASLRATPGAAARAKATPRKAAPSPPPAPPAPPPPPPPPPEPEPVLDVRKAAKRDAAAIAALLEVSEPDVEQRLNSLSRAGAGAVVAELKGVVGCALWTVLPSLDRPPLGRVALLLVDKAHRRRGIGRALLEAAEAELSKRGCAHVEALSEIELASAHGFFRRAGYERTSYRFAKPLAPDAD